MFDGFEFAGLPGDYQSPEENGGSFFENALIKAKAAAEAFGLPALADDSGLEVACLDGRPGIYSSRYGGEDTGFDRKMDLLLEEVGGKSDRSANFTCFAVLCFPDGHYIAESGRLFGEIAKQKRGGKGFGYDPVFQLPDGRTLAELTPDEKNSISHRAVAMRRLLDRLMEEK